MDIVAVDALLTLAGHDHGKALDAWTQAALFACELAEQQDAPLWRVLPSTLQSAGWLAEASSQQVAALSQLADLLGADLMLGSLLEEFSGNTLTTDLSDLLDAWWQRGLPRGGTEQWVLLASTLDAADPSGPQAQLYALTLPATSWRWLVRAHLTQVKLNRLSLRLDEQRHALIAPTLAARNRKRMASVRRARLDVGEDAGSPSFAAMMRLAF